MEQQFVVQWTQPCSATAFWFVAIMAKGFIPSFQHQMNHAILFYSKCSKVPYLLRE
jgi:hypothetical protein